MIYGAPEWEIPQAWFISYTIVSRYSTTMTNEIFPLMLLNWKKKNGGDALWCCSMGDCPRLVSFLLNCVKILHHNDQWNIAFDAPQLQEKQWWRYSMVLLNGRFFKLVMFLSQLCLDTPPKLPMKYWIWSSSIARKIMVEMLYRALQWEIHRVWYFPCSIVSRYSTTMTNEMFPLLVPQL